MRFCHRAASLRLHVRLLTRHNQFVFTALFCQFLLLFWLIHMLATATTALSHYLTPDTHDASCALLALDDERVTPDALRMIDGVDAVGYTAATDAVLDGRGCRLITYDPALRPLRHALSAGEWFDERYAEECVLGYALGTRYAVGDTITLWDEETPTPLTLRVAGILPPESYALTCAAPGDAPSLGTVLERENAHAPFVLRMATPSDTPRPRAVWVISDDSAGLAAQLRPFGTLTALDELTARARTQNWTQNRHTVTGLGFLFVLALFLCACSALLSFQKNRHTYAVLAMVGERRIHLLAAIGGIYALLIAAALAVATLLLRWSPLNARLLDGMPPQPIGSAVCAAVALLGAGACFGLTALLTRRSPLALYRQNR